MFTLRFCREDRDYKSYSIISYEVGRQPDGSAYVEMFAGLNGRDFDTEYVTHGIEGFNICYITNLAGKTIDVVKPVEMKGYDSE